MIEMSTLYLTEVRRVPATRQLRLEWNDGHRADFDYDYVRGYCPCAGCQEHGALAIEFHPPTQPVNPVKIEPVGNYAISIAWSDQHATGIYRFDFLRELCPCDSCRKERGEEPGDG